MNVVVLYKHALNISPDSGPDGLSMNLSLIAYIFRHSLKQVYPAELQAIHEHLDTTVCKSWQSFKANGLGAKTWWSGVGAVVGLVVDVKQVGELLCLDPVSDWSCVQAKLAEVVQATATGARLFGAAWHTLCLEKVAGVIKNNVDEMMSADVTVKSVDKQRDAFLNEARSMRREPTEPCPVREVDVRYRGAFVPVMVTSVFDEYLVSVSAAIRGAVVATAVLTPLLCEDELIDSEQPKPTAKIEFAVVEESAKARAAATELFRGKGQSASIFRQVFESQGSVLLQIDRGFRLEMAFSTQFRAAMQRNV